MNFQNGKNVLLCLSVEVIFISGWLFEATGSYNSSFYFTAACFLVCALLSFIIPASWYCAPCVRRRYNVTNTDLDISVIQSEVYTRTNEHSSSMLQVRF